MFIFLIITFLSFKKINAQQEMYNNKNSDGNIFKEYASLLEQQRLRESNDNFDNIPKTYISNTGEEVSKNARTRTTQQQQQQIRNKYNNLYLAYAPTQYNNEQVNNQKNTYKTNNNNADNNNNNNNNVASCSSPIITSPVFTQKPVMLNNPTIVELLKKQPRFGKLTSMIAMDGPILEELTKSRGPFTIFAPTDDALSRLMDGGLLWLIANPPLLKRFLQTHVVKGISIFAEDLKDEDRFISLDGSTHFLSVDAKGNLEIDTAARLYESEKNQVAENAIIHGIDNVLLPAGLVFPQKLPLCKNNCIAKNRPAPLLPICINRCAYGYNDY